MPEFILAGKESPKFLELDEFTQGYIEAIFFTEESPQTSTEDFINIASFELENNDGSIPSDLCFDDLAPESLEVIMKDCECFHSQHSKMYEGNSRQAGIDFWFTRNHHGAGFWDKPEIYGVEGAKRLTELSGEYTRMIYE